MLSISSQINHPTCSLINNAGCVDRVTNVNPASLILDPLLSRSHASNLCLKGMKDLMLLVPSSAQKLVVVRIRTETTRIRGTWGCM